MEGRRVGRRHEEGSRSGKPNAGYDDYRRRIAARIAAGRRLPPDAIQHLLETPAAFEAWLRSQAPEAIVGDYFTPDDSPLTNFIWDSLGVYVDIFDSVFDGERFHALPEWCAAFTRQEAEYIEHGWRDGSNEFTAAGVLDILRRVVGRG
jgi:hypothetical protein